MGRTASCCGGTKSISEKSSHWKGRWGICSCGYSWGSDLGCKRGVNVFFKIVSEAAKYLSDYDIEIMEAHHNQKKDAPSGTALRAPDVISEAVRGKKYIYGRKGIAPLGSFPEVHFVQLNGSASKSLEFIQWMICSALTFG